MLEKGKMLFPEWSGIFLVHKSFLKLYSCQTTMKRNEVATSKWSQSKFCQETDQTGIDLSSGKSCSSPVYIPQNIDQDTQVDFLSVDENSLPFNVFLCNRSREGEICAVETQGNFLNFSRPVKEVIKVKRVANKFCGPEIYYVDK